LGSARGIGQKVPIVAIALRESSMELAGHIVTPAGIVPGVLEFGAAIGPVRAAPRVPDRFVLPGFIDGHVHGGGGGDAMDLVAGDGPAGIAAMARFHLARGTTTLLPTTITRPWPEVMAALRGIAAARSEGIEGGALVHGAHLEGPFINPQRLGAQPPFAILPDPALIDEILALDVVRVVTLAVEMPGGLEAAAQFARAGVRVSLGHSAADYAAATAALDAVARDGGVAGGTHLFNAMGGIEGRAPGLAGALLASPHAFAELILDLHHVHAGSFRLALAALGDRLLLITDAIRGTGLGDGASELGGQPVIIRDGAARLANGSLAGSVLTMDAALRNAVASGVDLTVASRLASGNAARYLGLDDRGTIEAGRRADLVVLDADLAVQEVWLGGVRMA
jgi:N-acetylglucosamine-6-phosphate deacetylase